MILPSRKGWLKDYIRFRAGQKLDVAPDMEFEKQYYSLIQPTGIIYGHAVSLPYELPTGYENLNENCRFKLLMADSYLAGMMYGGPNNNPQDFRLNDYSFADVASYYSRNRRLWKKPLDAIQVRTNHQRFVEQGIQRSLKIRPKSGTAFWMNFFSNSLIFMDLINFNLWNRYGGEYMYDKEEICYTILSIIAAAAYADNLLEKEEKSIFEYFLYSARLPKNLKHEAELMIKTKITLDDINLHAIDHWLLKKYLLELAHLTVFSDQKINLREKLFITRLSEKLGLSDQEIDTSEIAIQSFVLENWKSVHYLQKRYNYQIVGQRFLLNAKRVMFDFKDKIACEISESQELVHLLNESRKRQLTDEEKKKVQEQIIDILKTLPAFVIVALPGTFLTLPVLLKILPPTVLPSAFHK